MNKTLVIVPTYNEIENLNNVVENILYSLPSTSILIVDDNSPDGTGNLAENISSSKDNVYVLHRKEKNGLGPAYIEGFRWGLSAGFNVLVEMDADGSHPASVLPDLIDAVSKTNGAGLAIGSRWILGGSVQNWPKYREFISRLGSWYARKLLGLSPLDVTAGFRAFRSEVLQEILNEEIVSEGYCFQIDLTRLTQNAGFTIVEIPINFKEREYGSSKMSGKIVAEAMWRVTIWGIQNLFSPKQPIN